jgi:DNA topoisomerase-1
VNDYLRQISGCEFTSKDFRTWSGTVLAAQFLCELGLCTSSSQAKRNVVRAVEDVAKRLGNTTAVCRKCYIHPVVLDGYTNGWIQTSTGRRRSTNGGRAYGLSHWEKFVLRLLQRTQRQLRAAA